MDKRFIEVFNSFKNDVYRLAYSYSKLDADDITQNVFVKLYNHKKILECNDVEIKKWLIKVTINECRTLFMSAWKRKMLFFKDNSEENILDDKKSNELLDVIMSLKKKYRIVIYLYYYEEYKIRDIAKLLNISETNVQTRLSRAREQLRSILKEEYDYEK